MKDSANVALVSSVIEPNVSEIAQNAFEIALDAALDEGVLKEIPIISWLVRTCAIGRGIRDRIFLKKIGLFLFEATKISQKERAAFSRRLTENPDLAERYGESALLLLEKLSEANKARLMGYAFRRFVQGHIDEVVLNRIYSAIEFLPLWQLIDLPEYYFENGLGSLSQSAAASYQQLWLVEVYYGDINKRLHCDFRTGESHFMTYHQPFYVETDIGRSIAELIRDYLNEPE